MSKNTIINIAYRLCSSAPARCEDEEMEGPSSHGLLAYCFLEVYPQWVSEQAHLILTFASPPAQDAVLAIPLLKGPHFFQVSIALFPSLPVQLTVRDPLSITLGPSVALELVDGQVLTRQEERAQVVTTHLDEAEKLFGHPVLWLDDLGYADEQAAWLLQAGARLVCHHQSPNAAYQVVRFLPGKQRYEYCFCFCSNQGLCQERPYTCLHSDLQDIKWEHGLDLHRFALSMHAEEEEL